MPFVGHGDAHDYSGNPITSLTMTYTAGIGNILAIYVSGSAQGTVSAAGVTVTGNAGSVITQRSFVNSGDAVFDSIWTFSCDNSKGDTSFTFNFNNASLSDLEFPLCVIAEYSGWGPFVAGSANMQIPAGSTGANVVTSGTASVSQGQNISGFSADISSGVSLSAGTSPISFTQDYYQNVGSTLNPYMLESAVAPSTASDAATFGASINDNFATGMLVFASGITWGFAQDHFRTSSYRKVGWKSGSAAALGAFFPITQPGDLRSPLYGYELTSPPLVTRQRSRVAAQVASGGSLSPSRATDLLMPQYGYELTSPPLATQQRVRVAAQVATGGSLSPSVSSDLATPQYGYALTSEPLVRVARKPDLPYALSRQDSDLSPVYGYDLFPQPPTERPRANPGATLAGNSLSPSVASDLLSPVYGEELTSAPLLTRRRSVAGLPTSTDQTIFPPQSVPPWYPWGFVAQADLRVRPRADLPVALNRQDTDLFQPGVAALLNGWDPTPFTTTRVTAARLGAALVGASLSPSNPTDLIAPSYGYELCPQPITTQWRARLPTASTDAVILTPQPLILWASWGWPIAPDYRSRQRVWIGGDIYNPADVFIPPPPPSVNWAPDFMIFAARPGSIRAAAAAGISLVPANPSDQFAPQYGYEFVSPPLLTRERRRIAGQVATGGLWAPTRASDIAQPLYGWDLVPPMVSAKHGPRKWLGGDVYNPSDILIVPPPPIVTYAPDYMPMTGRPTKFRAAATIAGEVARGFPFFPTIQNWGGVVWWITASAGVGERAWVSIGLGPDPVYQVRLRSLYLVLSGSSAGIATVVVRDGPTQTGGVIFEDDLYTAANSWNFLSYNGIDLRASVGNVLTVEFVAGTPGDVQEINAGGDYVAPGTPYGTD